ncbi:MAG: AzlC family ABC transporter permease [Pseudomonadota bacterium]
MAKPLSNSRRAFWRGVLAVLPVQMATIPFGMIFGVLADGAGLDLAQIFGFAAIVVAGASSLVALQMLQEQAPALLIVLAAGLVNLRMAMYSAAMVPHWEGAGRGARLWAGYLLNDQSFALSIRAYEDRRLNGLSERVAYFMGTGAGCIPVWASAVMAGAVLGQTVPQAWGLDAAIPVVFIALFAPVIRTPAQMAAAATAMGVAAPASMLPTGFGVIAASLAGIVVGMIVHRWSRA